MLWVGDAVFVERLRWFVGDKKRRWTAFKIIAVAHTNPQRDIHLIIASSSIAIDV